MDISQLGKLIAIVIMKGPEAVREFRQMWDERKAKKTGRCPYCNKKLKPRYLNGKLYCSRCKKEF